MTLTLDTLELGMSKQRVLSNVLMMGAGQVITSVLSLGQIILTSRYLGPSRLGELTLAWSIALMLGIVVELGMNTLIARTVARTPERTGVLLSTAILVRGMLAIPALLALVIYVQIAHLNTETRLAAYVVTMGVIMGSLSSVLAAALQGREQMGLGVIWLIASNALMLILAVLVVWLHGGVVAFATTSLLTEGLLLALNLRWVRRLVQLTWHVPLDTVREVFLGSLAFWGRNIFLTVYTYIDSIILAALAGAQAVGFYAPATRMFSVALFLPVIVGTATLPMLSRLGVDAGMDFARAGRKTLSLLFACGVPLVIGLATFAGPLILTIYGPAYLPSVPVLVVLSLCLLPMFVNIQFAQTLTACDLEWRWTLAIGVSCVTNPLINFALIPLAAQQWHNAALGAALALLATEFLMAAYGAVLLRDVLFDRTLGREVGGALMAGVAQVAVLHFTVVLWSPASEVLGVVVYVVVAAALGVFPREDLALLWITLSRYPRTFLVRSVSSQSAVAEEVPDAGADC